MKFTRDGWIWTISLFGSLVAAGVAEFGMLQSAFGIGDVWNDRLKVIALLIAVISGKFGFSPLPASPTAASKDNTK